MIGGNKMWFKLAVFASDWSLDHFKRQSCSIVSFEQCHNWEVTPVEVVFERSVFFLFFSFLGWNNSNYIEFVENMKCALPQRTRMGVMQGIEKQRAQLILIHLGVQLRMRFEECDWFCLCASSELEFFFDSFSWRNFVKMKYRLCPANSLSEQIACNPMLLIT